MLPWLVCLCPMRLPLFLVQPDIDPYVMDPDEPLAGTWKINDAPTMTGWGFVSSSSGISKGPIYFIVDHDQGSTKFYGLDVSTDKSGAISVSYWLFGNSGTTVYDSANGGWDYHSDWADSKLPYDHTYNQTIKVMSTDFYDSKTREYITAWLQANATKIS